jgi:hypothetical protein
MKNNYNDDDDDNDNEEYDDDKVRDMGNDDNVHGNANKGGRQFVESCLYGRDYACSPRSKSLSLNIE